jgi:hypothetical protein
MRDKATLFAFLILMLTVRFEGYVQDEPPLLDYTTSWIGNSFSGAEAGWVQNYIDTVYVHPDGTIYGGAGWDEGGGEVTVYKNGQVTGRMNDLHGWGRGGVTAVTRFDEYVYVAMTQGGCEGNEQEINDNELPAYPACSEDEDAPSPDWNAIRRYTPEGFAVPFPLGYGWDGSMMRTDIVGTIGGLAAFEGALYVSDTAGNRILVYSTTEFGTPPVDEWVMPAPKELVVGEDGTLYVLSQRGTAYEVLRFSLSGVPVHPALAFDDAILPTAIAVDGENHVWVTDDGIDQNVKRYTLRDDRYTLVSTLGEVGGVVGAGGRLGSLRFDGLTGIGIDDAGIIYVSESTQNTSLSAYTPAGERLWHVYSNEFVDSAVFDTRSDGMIVYTDDTRYAMDYRAAGGMTGTAEALTVNRFRYPDDPRLSDAQTPIGLRWLNDQRFLYATDMYASGVTVYRFDGEIAVPSSIFYIYGGMDEDPIATEEGIWLWRDMNGDGLRTRDEHVPMIEGKGWGIDVDAEGGLWFTSEDGARLDYFPFGGLDAHGNPIYDPATMRSFDAPQEGYWQRVIYDAASDTLYLGGYQDDENDECWGLIGKHIIRYDNWLAGGREPRWTIELSYACKGEAEVLPKAMTIAGDYLFTVEGYTAVVSVYDLETGAIVGTMRPGEEVGGISGWIDIPYGLHGVKRSNGEYVLLVEEDLYGKIIVYRWTP